jgi:6,7-dimethyl-8-ribityllumazine synthase
MELVLSSDILLNKKKVDGIIALGCIIKGETNHDKYISHSVCKGLLDVSLKHNLPVIFGVLTTNSKKQAVERAGGKCGNKGEDAAHTFLKMIEYQSNLDS